MLPGRHRLSNRRPSETIEISFNNIDYTVTVGFYPDTGRVGEVFIHGAKVGSEMDAMLNDACIAVSLLLQYGVTPQQLASSIGRPTSIIGALADLLAYDVVD